MSAIEDDDDLGVPIDFSPLLDADRQVDRDGIARRIERRQVSADLTTFFWVAPAEILRGFLQGMFGPPRAASEGRDG